MRDYNDGGGCDGGDYDDGNRDDGDGVLMI
jgi:hypothetical protein